MIFFAHLLLVDVIERSTMRCNAILLRWDDVVLRQRGRGSGRTVFRPLPFLFFVCAVQVGRVLARLPGGARALAAPYTLPDYFGKVSCSLPCPMNR